MVQFLLLVRQPLFDRAALPLTQTSWVLPPLSVGKMTLRLYSAIKLQPWSFKRAEFWHRTGWRMRQFGAIRSRLVTMNNREKQGILAIFVQIRPFFDVATLYISNG